VLDAMGLVLDDQWLTVEGLVGTTLRVRVAGRSPQSDVQFLTPEIAGSAHLTGTHQFIVEAGDDVEPFAIGG